MDNWSIGIGANPLCQLISSTLILPLVTLRAKNQSVALTKNQIKVIDVLVVVVDDVVAVQVHHIDRHELQIDSVSLSTAAGIAVTVTRRFRNLVD